MKRTIKPNKNKISALRSIFSALAVVLRMPRKDNKQLLINTIIAKAAPSSIKVDSVNLEILTDVKTIKQKPNKLADVVKICGDLFSFSIFIALIC